MPNVNVAEAKAKLSELLDRAVAGEDIVIARAGKPLARLVPVNPIEPRKPGAWRGWGASIPTEVFLAPSDPEDLMPPKANSPTISGSRDHRPKNCEAAARYSHCLVVALR
ncbi:MAG: type II toxin-antitoxin system prevent-host-death family antitoxin [Stellaceae bacterium]